MPKKSVQFEVMDVISKACRGNYRYIDCIGEEISPIKRDKQVQVAKNFGCQASDSVKIWRGVVVFLIVGEDSLKYLKLNS